MPLRKASTATKKPAKRVNTGKNKASASDRRALFIEAYLLNGGNAAQAYISSGHSPRGANGHASRMANEPAVKAEIDRRRAEVIAEAQKHTQLTADEVLRSCARDIRFDPAKIYNLDGSLKNIHEIDEDTRLCLRGMDVNELTAGDVVIGRATKVKFPEKNVAREQGMKHFGLYEKDNNQKPPAVIVVSGLDVDI